ncbi:MAG TPA: hypothetical protein VEG64_06960 [Candidatus Sulfotelmatobacter sp.]|nr:hypothetical protein [Candidatus Sulfotelmatobacter sp.]
MSQPSKKRFEVRPYAVGIVVIHLALNVAHGIAHSQLGIGLDLFQEVFVGVVVFAAPLFAGYWLWKNRLREGGLLLAVSMAGAFAFGVYFHFIHPGPDNVSFTNPGASPRARELFEYTSMDLAISEALGVLLGLAAFIRSFAPAHTAATRDPRGQNSA